MRGRTKPLLFFAAFVSVAAAVAASCTALLSLDDKQDASQAMCGRITDCYGDASAVDSCVDRLASGAETDAGLAWLKVVATEGCLDTCLGARACLDDVAFCRERGEQCGSRDECCSFVTGRADCEDGRCCGTAGQSCEKDQECCPSVGSCDPDTHTCGGTLCRDAGAPCGLGEQCCSGTCVGRACNEQLCGDDNFGCAKNEDCCSGYCGGGRCGYPDCKQLGVPCVDDDQCCPQADGGPGICATVDHVSLCSTGQGCFPLGSDCSVDGQCCTGACDPAFLKCANPCTVSGEDCTLDGECCSGHCAGGTCSSTCSTSYCKTDLDCCSRACILGTCAASTCKTTTCSHGLCTIGPPLQKSPSCGPGIDTCILAVCKADPFCCCSAWDSSCVAAAKVECQALCH